MGLPAVALRRPDFSGMQRMQGAPSEPVSGRKFRLCTPRGGSSYNGTPGARRLQPVMPRFFSLLPFFQPSGRSMFSVRPFVPKTWGSAAVRVAVVMLVLAVGRAGAVSGQAADPVVVVTGKVCSTSFSERQTFVGSVEAIRQAVVGSAVAGRVQMVNIDIGSRVRGPQAEVAGESVSVPAVPDDSRILARIETGTLEIEIDAAKIQRDLVEQAGSELKMTLPDEIRLAEARVRGALSRSQYSQSEYDRLKRMAGNNAAVSQTELEQARSQAEIDAALAAETEVDLERLRATADLRLLQAASRLAAAEQEIVRLEDQKSKHAIRAPFDGFVINKLTEAGAWITVGSPVAEIVDLQQVDFVFPVPQEFVGRVQAAIHQAEAQSQRPRVEVAIVGMEEPFEGELLTLSPQVDLRTRQVNVRARLANREMGNLPMLKPGMIGRASVSVGIQREITVISRDALVLGTILPTVYKLEEGSQPGQATVTAVSVKLGESLGSWIEVLGDLHSGEQVVVEGNERLRDRGSVIIASTRPDVPEDNGTGK